MAHRFPDNELFAGIFPIKESSADTFGDQEASSDGWSGARLSEIGRVGPSGERSFSRDKEYNFRPKVALFHMDQVNYRQFTNPDGGSEDRGNRGTSFDPGSAVTQGSLTFGIGTNPNEGGSSQPVLSRDVGFELSTVCDEEGELKSKPSFNPSHMNGPNRSTLLICERLLEGKDLPPRYFGRSHDLFLVESTQKIKLNRVRFNGGGGNVGTGFDPGSDTEQGSLTFGIGTNPNEDGGGFFSREKSDEEYEDGMYKGVWNITPLDKPIEGDFDQKSEENGGPGKYGYAVHDYIEGYPVDPKGGEPAVYHQGGWLYDARQRALAHISDILGIDSYECPPAKLPRYKNRYDEHVGIAYLRHDVHFQKEGDDDCPPPLGQGSRQSGRLYFTRPFS
jgi:hypothetical protein